MEDAWDVILEHLIQPQAKMCHQQPMAAVNLICSQRSLWLAHSNSNVWRHIEHLIRDWPSYIAFRKRHKGLSLRSKLITWAGARTGTCSFCGKTPILLPMHHLGVKVCAPCSRAQLVSLAAFNLRPPRFQWLPDTQGHMRQFALWRDLIKVSGKSKEELLKDAHPLHRIGYH